MATPVFLRDLGAARTSATSSSNKQKNELNSIGFNADWRVTDSFTLGAGRS